jgi:hypothetical protein
MAKVIDGNEGAGDASREVAVEGEEVLEVGDKLFNVGGLLRIRGP